VEIEVFIVEIRCRKDSFSVAGGFFGEEADVVYAAVALGGKSGGMN
jgi:hypothetical protein